MARYRTCYGCPADDGKCPRKEAVRFVIGGLSVTSIGFTCQIKRALFRPGQRVRAVITTTHDYFPGKKTEYALGTVIEWVGAFDAKLRILLNAEDVDMRDYGFTKQLIKLYPWRLVAVDEPDDELCPECSMPPRKMTFDWRCDTCGVDGWKEKS